MALVRWERPFPRSLWPDDRFDRLFRDMFTSFSRPVEKWPMRGATEKDVTATYKDGVLEVRLPLAAEEEKPTKTRGEVTHG